MLSPEERRRFRRLERGLRITDPAWLARHYPRRRRYADLSRLVVAMLASGLVAGGVVAGAMPTVCCGIFLGVGAATSFVSSRSTTGMVRERGGPARSSATGRLRAGSPRPTEHLPRR